MEAMGLENRLPNDEELERMCAVTRREMEAGAVGLSTGLIYMPCAYSESREIIEMCKVVAEYDGLLSSTREVRQIPSSILWKKLLKSAVSRA